MHRSLFAKNNRLRELRQRAFGEEFRQHSGTPPGCMVNRALHGRAAVSETHDALFLAAVHIHHIHDFPQGNLFGRSRKRVAAARSAMSDKQSSFDQHVEDFSGKRFGHAGVFA